MFQVAALEITNQFWSSCVYLFKISFDQVQEQMSLKSHRALDGFWYDILQNKRMWNFWHYKVVL